MSLITHMGLQKLLLDTIGRVATLGAGGWYRIPHGNFVANGSSSSSMNPYMS